MKKSNLRNFQAYRMYQAPEGGGEKPLRTSYLKDLLEGSASRGGGGTGGHKLSGQNMSGQKLSGQKMSTLLRAASRPVKCDGSARRVVPLERAGSCPVVDLLDPSSQQPSNSGSIAKPASNATRLLFKGLDRSNGDRGDRLGVIDTVTDGHGGCIVSTIDDLGGGHT